MRGVLSKDKHWYQEFKIEAVRQTNERGYSVAEVSELLGILLKTLYLWQSKLLDKAKFKSKSKSSKSSDEQLKIAQLEAELEWTKGNTIYNNGCKVICKQL